MQRRFREKLYAKFLTLECVSDEDVKTRNREIWTRQWVQRRKERGAFQQLVSEFIIEYGPRGLGTKDCNTNR